MIIVTDNKRKDSFHFRKAKDRPLFVAVAVLHEVLKTLQKWIILNSQLFW